MRLDPRTPIVVGASQLNGDDSGSEPIAMMSLVAEDALGDSGSSSLRDLVQSVRVVKGIWPYADPGRLIADSLGLDDVTTALTSLGGNAAYDLVNETARQIQAGELDAALICSAETMRTRRRDKAGGRHSPYLAEASDPVPDLLLGNDRDLTDRADREAGTDRPVNFYAMVESALRHRRGETASAHVERISTLWAVASDVAARNPHAWSVTRHSAESIAMVRPENRMVAAPYPKLMTSNIDVDQAAALVVCSVAAAESAGVPPDRYVFLHAGTGADDHRYTRQRWALDESPAMRIAGQRVGELASVHLHDVDLLDLYSCFPSAVQVAQRELGLDPACPFTITGGLTFAGGPFNSYCMQAFARTVELLRESAGGIALLSGVGGFFTKHSFCIAGSAPPTRPFAYERPQAEIDALPSRPSAQTTRIEGEIEAYTVTYNRSGEPTRAIVSVLESAGARGWANSDDGAVIDGLLTQDHVGQAWPI